jgi:7-cyano-7-deazaguanine synthase
MGSLFGGFEMKTIAIVSGGLDSVTMLYFLLLQEQDEVKVISFNYGQRHKKELSRAGNIAKKLNVEWKLVDLKTIKELLGGSSQTSPEIEPPDGRYDEESMKITVVPNRNMIMLSIAAGWAISNKFQRVAYAAHAGDHTIYPDCRKVFIDALDFALSLSDWSPVSLYAPFSNISKSKIVLVGQELGVPFEDTWSCYKGLEKHCGTCGTCVERKEAFKLAGVEDPTEYA